MSQTSARTTAAVVNPIPGMGTSLPMRGSRPKSSRSARSAVATSGESRSISRRLASRRAWGMGRSPTPWRNWRPPGPNRSLTGGEIAWSASRAWVWHFRREEILAREIRVLASLRASRTSGGAAQASGSRLVRSRWASVLASTLSFFTRAEEMALVARGWAMWAGMPTSESRSVSRDRTDRQWTDLPHEGKVDLDGRAVGVLAVVTHDHDQQVHVALTDQVAQKPQTTHTIAELMLDGHPRRIGQVGVHF